MGATGQFCCPVCLRSNHASFLCVLPICASLPDAEPATFREYHDRIDSLTVYQIVWIVASLGVASFVQGVIGFGAGMIAVPIMVWVGVDLPLAVAALLPAVLVQTGYGVWRFRRDWVWRDLIHLNVYRLPLMPVGIGIMALVAGADVDLIKQYVGGLLLLAVGLMVVGRVEPREKVSAKWTALAGATSGVLAGAVGMGGPPVVLWVQAHAWSTRRIRTYLWSCFLLISPLQMLALSMVFGARIWAVALVGFLATPLILLATWGGSRVGDRLDRTRLRQIAFLVLIGLGVWMLAGPWL